MYWDRLRKSTRAAEVQLTELDQLRQKSLISQTEYDDRRRGFLANLRAESCGSAQRPTAGGCGADVDSQHEVLFVAA